MPQRSELSPRVMWFRRDLRLSDNPALLAAAGGGHPVTALYIWDPDREGSYSDAQRAYLLRSLRALRDQLRGNLTVLRGAAGEQLLRAARQFGADQVHISADLSPGGAEHDAAVERVLAEHGVQLNRTGSGYAVAPGRVRKADGTPYRVFTPFYRAWVEHGWRAPAGDAERVQYVSLPFGNELPAEPLLPGELSSNLPEAGETASRQRLDDFLDESVADYQRDRDRPDRPGTSRLSAALKLGELHPRTILARLTEHRGEGAETFRKELAWREFYADVLHHTPDSDWKSLDDRMAGMAVDEGPDADQAFEAWAAGRTGYPIVDAGMRQLAYSGWMHNRVRMITASFLVKDLHITWQRGARHFLDHLVDADLASNNHGWQWVAGVGTDAAPYFRVFNPTLQGRKLDPDGDYMRQWVPELADLDAKHIHEPNKAPGGVPSGYPEPIVDHAAERSEALRRYNELKSDRQLR
jgi:deoxyribodipyrimidine photo-lyase